MVMNEMKVKLNIKLLKKNESSKKPINFKMKVSFKNVLYAIRIIYNKHITKNEMKA